MLLEGNLTRAIALAESGDRRTAARLLAAWVQAHPDSELAWYWLGQCLEDPRQRRQCYERVLALNPAHEAALRMLIRLENELRPTPPANYIAENLGVVPPPTVGVRDDLRLAELPPRPAIARLLKPALAAMLVLVVLVFAWLALLI
ncbi:MAG: tetratricopeptide repeat protein [Chloroflexi bacterium]|nr:tetratricopeptide repeat protein [Chloroflexota bacterium]